MSDAQAPTKTCVLCRTDVAGKPRHKDARGRYFCEPCFARAKDHLARKKAGQAAGRHHASDSSPARVSGAEPLVLPDEPDLSSVHEEPAGPVVLRQQQTCPKCDRPLAVGAVVCTGCGYNSSTGRATGTAIETDTSLAGGTGPNEATVLLKKGGLCGKCGYNLSQGKGLRCPECGMLNRIQSKRDEYAEDSRRTVRLAYLKPAVISLIGIFGVAMILAFRQAVPIEYGYYAALYGAIYVVGLVVYYLCSITWLGVDEPFHLMALRMLAVYSMTNVSAVLVEPFPIWFVKYGVVTAVHVISLVLLMEIDIEDAWIVALITLLARFAVVLTAIWLFVANQ